MLRLIVLLLSGKEIKVSWIHSSFQRVSSVKNRSPLRAFERLGSEEIARCLLLFRDSEM